MAKTDQPAGRLDQGRNLIRFGSCHGESSEATGKGEGGNSAIAKPLENIPWAGHHHPGISSGLLDKFPNFRNIQIQIHQTLFGEERGMACVGQVKVDLVNEGQFEVDLFVEKDRNPQRAGGRGFFSWHDQPSLSNSLAHPQRILFKF